MHLHVENYFLWLPECDNNMRYLSPINFCKIPRKQKFRGNRQIPLLGSKFRVHSVQRKTLVTSSHQHSSGLIISHRDGKNGGVSSEMKSSVPEHQAPSCHPEVEHYDTAV